MKALALALLLAPGAASAVEAWGAGLWYAKPDTGAFGSSLSLVADASWKLPGPFALRTGARLGGPIAVRGFAVGDGRAPIFARAVQLSPFAHLLLFSESRSSFLALGGGFAYHFRFVTTDKAALGQPADGAHPELGTISSLDVADAPGFDLLAEACLPVSSTYACASVGWSRETARVLARTREYAGVQIAQARALSGLFAELALRFPAR